MKALNIGELNLRVAVETLTDSVDASGTPLETWTTLHPSVPMGRPKRSMLAGSETFKADQLSGKSMNHWLMRYAEWMDPDKYDVLKSRRLKYFNHIHDIVNARTLDRMMGIVLVTISHSKAVPS